MDRAESRARVAAAATLGRGERIAPVKALLYPLYVLALFAAVYGQTIARALILLIDPAAVAAALSSWQAGLVVIVILVLGVRAAQRVGRRRGPAVPPLPWVELVTGTALDRSDTLRGWWWQSVVALVGAGFIVGGTVGASLWISGSFGWAVFVACLLGTPLVAFAGALLWLRGQASLSDPPLNRPRVPSGDRTDVALVDGASTVGAAASRARWWAPWRGALQRMALRDLRVQSARAAAIELGVFDGNARAVRAQVATPVTAGRSLRLRPGGPVTTMIRRDLLSLRRSPETALLTLVIGGLATAGIGWYAATAGRPVMIAALVAWVGYLAFGLLCEGLRRQADHGGAHPFLGLTWRRELGAHLVLPVIVGVVAFVGLSAVVAAVTGGPGQTRAAGSAALGAAVGGLALVALYVGLATWAAFRGPSPYPAYEVNGRWFAAAWFVLPGLAAAVCGAGIQASVLHHDELREALMGAVASQAGFLAIGWNLVRVVWPVSSLLFVLLGWGSARRAWSRARG